MAIEDLERLAGEWRNHGLHTQAQELVNFTRQQKNKGLLHDELPPLVGNQEIIERVRREALDYFSTPEPDSPKMIALLDWIDQGDLPRRETRANMTNNRIGIEEIWGLRREFDTRFQHDIDSVVGFYACWEKVLEFESQLLHAFPVDPHRSESVLDEMINIRNLIQPDNNQEPKK